MHGPFTWVNGVSAPGCMAHLPWVNAVSAPGSMARLGALPVYPGLMEFPQMQKILHHNAGRYDKWGHGVK